MNDVHIGIAGPIMVAFARGRKTTGRGQMINPSRDRL